MDKAFCFRSGDSHDDKYHIKNAACQCHRFVLWSVNCEACAS